MILTRLKSYPRWIITITITINLVSLKKKKEKLCLPACVCVILKGKMYRYGRFVLFTAVVVVVEENIFFFKGKKKCFEIFEFSKMPKILVMKKNDEKKLSTATTRQDKTMYTLCNIWSFIDDIIAFFSSFFFDQQMTFVMVNRSKKKKNGY